MINNLIGISGKINSGKDTVGKIIQYLDSEADDKYSFDRYCEVLIGTFGIGYYPEFKIVKFADKLKDIVCLLIGCTRKQLEDRTFKEKELGEQWSCYKTFVIHAPWIYQLGVTVDDIKNNQLYYERMGWRNETEQVKLTPRLLLQLLGTECGRQIIHPNIWVNATFADYRTDFEAKNAEEWGKDLASRWIITDTRFKNEADYIKSMGGILIRIDRPCNECGGMGYHKLDCGIGRLEHRSETDLDNYNFDYIIYNNGSIEDLVVTVKNIFRNDT